MSDVISHLFHMIVKRTKPQGPMMIFVLIFYIFGYLLFIKIALPREYWDHTISDSDIYDIFS